MGTLTANSPSYDDCSSVASGNTALYHSPVKPLHTPPGGAGHAFTAQATGTPFFFHQVSLIRQTFFITPSHDSRSYAHRTLRDTRRQLPTRKLCNVRGATTQRDTTRQKSGLVVSDLTMPDICDKAPFLSCLVVSSHRSPHFLVGSCLLVSCNVRCGGHKTGKNDYAKKSSAL